MIEILASISIAVNDRALSVMPSDNEVMASMSVQQQSMESASLPERDEIVASMSVPSAPYALQGGMTATELRDMRTKVIRVGR